MAIYLQLAHNLDFLGRMDGARALSGHGRRDCSIMQGHEVSKTLVSYPRQSIEGLHNTVLAILGCATGRSYVDSFLI